MRNALIGISMGLILGGCGSSGAAKLAPPSGQTAVAARQAQLMRAFAAGSVPQFMACLAPGYHDDYGVDKSQMQAMVTTDFASYTTQAVTLVDEQIGMSSDGKTADLIAHYNITDTWLATNDRESYPTSMHAVWHLSGGTWFVQRFIKPIQVQAPARRFLF